MAERDPKITQALSIAGIDAPTWDDTPEEKRGEFFKDKMVEKLDALKLALEETQLKTKVPNADPVALKMEKAIQDDISLLEEVSNGLPSVNPETDASEPEPLKEKKEPLDKNGKTWAEIMYEILESQYNRVGEDTIEKYNKMYERLLKAIDSTPEDVKKEQRKIYLAKEKELKGNKTEMDKWIKEHGAMGRNIKDPEEYDKLEEAKAKAAVAKDHALETYRQQQLIEENTAPNAPIATQPTQQQNTVPSNSAGNTSTLPASISSPVPTPQQQMDQNNEEQKIFTSDEDKQQINQQIIDDGIKSAQDELDLDKKGGTSPLMTPSANPSPTPEESLKTELDQLREKAKAAAEDEQKSNEKDKENTAENSASAPKKSQ